MSVVALYARVSSDTQAKNSTIDSQVDEICARIADDGHTLTDNMKFLDDGYTGSSLNRPGLESLREAVYGGAVDVLYVNDPDRLARNYAHMLLLCEEFSGSGVEIVFLREPPSDDPQSILLRQIKGVISEYERQKIIERTKRGRKYAARRGDVSVLGHAPYGYSYIKKQDGVPASFQVNDIQGFIVI